MRRLNLVLLASLQLAQARQPSFSIHDDVLAHPEVRVSKSRTTGQLPLSSSPLRPNVPLPLPLTSPLCCYSTRLS